ncbi:holo-ACP synthase [Spiroplasma platyhelix]|uniref:Holo-[acyl-carrier-protein] synthase n=1 Tax=Spiroplasma platyhelix PALS-1 TaxID=1276218 RepID=A0A846TVW4_9MOLU|nr:4'-phosphopantetheinyl transferase superfamily protein [Spiroplasma platyhelix]MBE4703919.1 Holo-[acyl-carrier-protein] synthase [Spiroplasma platyhelix PALS-1]NKE38292.1 4'-phosphopantetheinyl transferase superfamily protein [Spiroplasma platyhelix PALS-1]UJB29177.1 holo-[acyl-carrier-protein] synthase [Spiroplasma platyhelix PALS-1]
MKNVGIDIIEINRMQLKPEFIKRYLSQEEWKEFQTLATEFSKKQFLASKWALKEAIYKALPSEHLVFDQINITENEYGQPTVKIKDYQISLSLSHNQTNVVAIAICH